MLPQNLKSRSQNEHSNTSQSVKSRIGTSSEETPRVASKCSCFQCNSIDCFEIRNLNSNLPCTCANCKEKKVCSHSANNLVNNKSDKNKNFIEITRGNVTEHEQKDSLKQHTKSKDAEFDVSENTKYHFKDILLITDKINLEQQKPYEKSVKRNYSVTINYSRREEKKEYGNSTAKLSAEIMNLPYSDFKGSLSTHKLPLSFDHSNLTKLDLLTKLKEIYKACSCKVCECITGKSCIIDKHVTRDTCSCVESDSYKLEFHKEPKQIPHPGCPCYSCDRKDCKGVVKEAVQPASCDCEPCDCIKYSKSITTPCECEPCQCAECTSLTFYAPRSIIVAPVQGNFQQNLCQCEPCDCVNCSQNYGAMASSLMHEASTGMVTQRNCHCETCLNNACQLEDADCRCDVQNKIMRKPIDRHNRDYDLRRASVGDNSFSQMNSQKSTNHDTIAMFTLSNFLSNTAFHRSKDRCQCQVCECIVCKDMERYGDKNKKSYLDFYNKYSNLSSNLINTCKCQSCECQICNKDQKAQNAILERKNVRNKCGCDICDCITCEGHCCRISTRNIHHNKKINETKAYIFEDNCNDVSKDTQEIVYPLKKGKQLTPSMFKDHSIKLQCHSSLRNLKNELPSKSILKEDTRKSNKHMISSRSQPFSHNEYLDRKEKQSSNPNLRKKVLVTPNDPCTNNNTENLSDNLKDTLNSRIFSNNTINIKKSTVTRTHTELNGLKSMNNKNSKTNIPEIRNDIIKKYLIPSKRLSLIYIDKSNEGNKLDFLKINLNSNISPKSKWTKSEEYFCTKIKSFEKSISQLQEDITRHLNTLEEIRKNNVVNDTPMIYKCKNYLNKKISEVNLRDKVISDETSACMNKNILETTRPIKTVLFREEPDKSIILVEEMKAQISDNKENPLINKELNDNNSTKNNTLNNTDNKLYKMYTSLIKRAQFNVRMTKLKKKVTRSSKTKLSHDKDHVKKEQTIERNRYSRNKLTLSLHTTNNKSTCVSLERIIFTEPDVNNKDKVVIRNEENEQLKKDMESCDDKENWSILKKNLYFNNVQTTKSKSVCTIPILECNIKRAVKSISLQTTETHKALSKLDFELNHVSNDASSQTKKKTMTVEKETNFNFEQLKEVLIQDVQHLVDMLLTRIVCKSELTKPKSEISEQGSIMPRINSVKSSCDGLKVSFMGLRKVSDHSVLVRWKMPREMSEVQGYELQVDGRAVQKILSPSRCMAVLTCLPHCEKLLLTIRTLTTTARRNHHPTATIVYFPREKLTHYTRPMFFADQ